MKEVHVSIRTQRPIGSLNWVGEELFDWVGGGDRYTLDGKIFLSNVNFAYRFDHAFVSADGQYAAVVELLGTKGLLLKKGKVLREFNRSFYRANDYSFPFTFIDLPDGRSGMVHCPERYCKLDIEEVESGSILSKRGSEGMPSCFHSRLAATSDGKFLLSAGWVWSPIDRVWLYDIADVLKNPDVLDNGDLFSKAPQEMDNAAFQDDDKIVVTTWTYDDDNSTEENVPEHILKANSIATYDLKTMQLISQAPLEGPTGSLLPLGEYVVSFFEYPKLIKLKTGKVIKGWPELRCGESSTSIMDKAPPALAIDPKHKRFALACEGELRIVMFS